MKKLLVVLLLGLLWAGTSEAAGSNRGAKPVTNVNYTTTVSTVSIGPSVLYELILSTPATAGDYVVIWDSASATGYSIGTTTNLKARVVASTTAVTFPVIQFDPPLQFNNGIMVGLSAAANAAGFVYEKGRIVQGY